MTLSERIERESQKKLLAIDGGGIRGVLALGVLQRIEDLLKAKSERPRNHVGAADHNCRGMLADGVPHRVRPCQ
jgi:hypothetical protein